MSCRYTIPWSDVGITDMEGAVERVAESDRVPEAEMLWNKLDTTIGSLATAPTRGRMVPELRAEGLETYREVMVSKNRVLFRVRGREVVLLGVLDGRRDLSELLIQRSMGDIW